jgi:hypothetical protein
MRRFTRLTSAFPKKLDNLNAAVALYYMHDSFARIHQPLRVPRSSTELSFATMTADEARAQVARNPRAPS